MLRKASFLECAAVVLENLRTNTTFPWYDAIPLNAPAPLGFCEVVGKVDSSSKTTFKESFTVNLHVIAPASEARTKLYEMITETEEAMTERLSFAEPVMFLRTSEVGVNSMQRDETGEYHAVLQYNILVSYGLRVKTL